MKTLIVRYLPRGERSHTRALLEGFRSGATGQDVETLDLIEDRPDVFDPANLMAYIRRDYLGEALEPEAAAAMEKMDRMTAQFLRADATVLAAPMYNFSLPAVVKAWFDSVMLKGKTWDMGPEGPYGLLKGRKALILMASGGVYEGDWAAWNHATTLAETEFRFMGFEDIRTVTAQGLNVMPEKADAIVAAGVEAARAVARAWYG